MKIQIISHNKIKIKIINGKMIGLIAMLKIINFRKIIIEMNNNSHFKIIFMIIVIMIFHRIIKIEITLILIKMQNKIFIMDRKLSIFHMKIICMINQ